MSGIIFVPSMALSPRKILEAAVQNIADIFHPHHPIDGGEE
jgi:hypothetical protein